MSRVEVIGVDDVRRMLDPYMEPKLTKRMQQAITAGAKVYVPPLRSEARSVSKRMARAATQNKTGQGIRGTANARKRAGRDPRAFVGFRIKTAFFSHMVVGGTKGHPPARKRAMVFRGKDGGLVVTQFVRGVPPNPMIARVAERHEGQAYAAIGRELDRTE